MPDSLAEETLDAPPNAVVAPAERPHLPSRIAWGLCSAGFAVGVVDLLVVQYTGEFTDEGQLEVLRFAPRLLLAVPLLLACAGYLGTCAHTMLSARFGTWGSLAGDLLASAPLLACIPPLFEGPAIRASSARVPLLLATCVACVGGVVALRLVTARAVRMSIARRLDRAAVFMVVLLGMAAALGVAALATSHVLRGLYPSFHRAVALIALSLSAAVAIGAVARWRRFPARWLVLAVPLLWGTASAMDFEAAGGRQVLHERAPFGGAFMSSMFQADLALRMHSTLPGTASSSAGTRTLADADFAAGAIKRHVLLVTVDALRGDVLRSGSRFFAATPGLRRIAGQTVDFERAYSPSNGTARSLPAILTGLRGARARTDPAQFLPRVFARQGYHTTAWVTAHDKQSADHDLTHLRDRAFHFAGYRAGYVAAAEVVSWAERQLAAAEPIFVWIHLSDVHAPYGLALEREVDGGRFDDEYGVRLAVLDRVLAAFLQHVRARGDVVFAFTADHGESRGERGIYGHASNLYDEQIRVPLLIGEPGIGASLIRDPVSTADLGATLLRLAGARLPHELPVLPLSEQSALSPGSAALSYSGTGCALIERGYKLIADRSVGSVSLFDLAADPDERQNRVREQQSRTRALFAAMQRACPVDLSPLAPLL